MADPLPFIRPARITAEDSELARVVKMAIIVSPYRHLKGTEEAAGLPGQSLVLFLRAPLRQSPERRRLVMEGLNRLLGLPVERLASLAGVLPSGEVGGTDGGHVGIEGLTERQSAAAIAFRTVVGDRPWPGFEPDAITWKGWPMPLRTAWRTLRAADASFTATHRRAPQPSFTTWRLVIERDRPGFTLTAGGDEDLAALERQALAAGLDALAAHLVPEAPAATPEPAPTPEGGNETLAPSEPEPQPEPMAEELPPAAPVPAQPPPAPRPKVIKTGKRGRPTKETALALRVRGRMEAMGIPTITILEQRAGLPVDGFRGILRGQVGRNKALKLYTLERVASVLKIPPSELAELAGLVEMDRRKIDHGTAEAQMRRQALAAGGDPRLCGTALGVLLAHDAVEGRMGISQIQHDVGQRFADLMARPMPGAPRRPRSELERFAYPGGRHDTNLDAMVLQTDIARLAWRSLVAGDREATHGPRPSAMVWRVAVQGILPRWAEPLAAGPWPHADRLEWLALRQGLQTLRRHFGLNEDHRTIVGALNELRGTA